MRRKDLLTPMNTLDLDNFPLSTTNLTSASYYLPTSTPDATMAFPAPPPPPKLPNTNCVTLTTVTPTVPILPTSEPSASSCSAGGIIISRCCLHASFLRLRHPGSGNMIEFFAPLFPDMEAILTVLREASVSCDVTTTTPSTSMTSL